MKLESFCSSSCNGSKKYAIPTVVILLIEACCYFAVLVAVALVYQNNGTVAMFRVYQANTVRGEPEYSRQKVLVPEHKVEILYLGNKVQGRSQAIDL